MHDDINETLQEKKHRQEHQCLHEQLNSQWEHHRLHYNIVDSDEEKAYYANIHTEENTNMHPRKYTIQMLQMIEDQQVDKDLLLNGLLNWLSDPEVQEFMQANDYVIDMEDEE